MLRIGLCGGSGVGKGYISKILKEYGFECLDTDLLVHRMYSSDRELIDTISKEFGSETVSPDGSVDRAVLRGIVFSDKKALDKLNRLVHARVGGYCLDWMAEREIGGARAAFIDAPQLFEAGMEGCFDYIIAVVSPDEERIERILKRDMISRENAEKRIACQMTNEEYSEKCHFTIDNSANSDSKEQLKNILKKIGLVD